MDAFKLVVIFFVGQVNSFSKANHLVVSGTNHTHPGKGSDTNFEDRSFDGVYAVVQNQTEFFGAEFNGIVYKRLNDPDDDIHIIAPVGEDRERLSDYRFLPSEAVDLLDKFGLYPRSKRTWVMRRGKKRELLGSKSVWISRLTDPEDDFNPNYPPIDGWTLFTRPKIGSMNCTELSREDTEQLHKRIRVSAVRADVSSQTLLDLYESDSDQVRELFMFCTGQNNERLFMSRDAEDGDPWYCGGLNDCKPGKPATVKEENLEYKLEETHGIGIDEYFCPFFVSTSILIPICCTLVMMSVGFLLYVGYDLLFKERKEKTSRRRNFKMSPVEEKVNAIIQSLKEGGEFPENAFALVHETDGGMELLLGCCFDFRRHPMTWHHMAKLIHAEEQNTHEHSWHDVNHCMRRKAKSRKATTQFLRSLEPPNVLKICLFHVQEALSRLTDPSNNNHSTRCGGTWTKLKMILINSLLPISKTSMYILDYIKDGCLFLFLVKRAKFVYSRAILLRRLIVCHGVSIVLSSCVVGWAIQMNNTIINLSGVQSPACEHLLRVCIFLVTPLIPVAIIYKAVSFSIQKQRLKADWRRSNDCRVTTLWFSLNIIQRKNRNLMVAYSDFKIVEASLEAIPQIYFLRFLAPSQKVISWPHICGSDNFWRGSFPSPVVGSFLCVLHDIDHKRNGHPKA